MHPSPVSMKEATMRRFIVLSLVVLGGTGVVFVLRSKAGKTA